MSKDARTISLAHWLEHIETLHPKEVEFGLDRVREVAQRGSFDQLNCPAVVVGGTNGKGSTVALTAKLLQSCGLKVGCYYSPHLTYFNERIVINGESCPEHLICGAFASVEKARGQVQLTYFEFITLAAFELFKQSDLDVVILEVGCGGEKDAVNLVSSVLSIITTIGLDHTDWLGNDLESIASAKAGILRKGVPALIGLNAQIPSLISQAQIIGCDLYLEDQSFGWSDVYQTYWAFQGKNVRVPSNPIPMGSVSLSLAAVHILSRYFPVLEQMQWERLGLILRSAQLPGRFQRIQGRVEVLLDVAHNPQGAEWLAEKLKANQVSGKTFAVWSSYNDKDCKGIVAPMKSVVDEWFTAPLDHPRSSSVEELDQALNQYSITSVKHFESVLAAFRAAENQATSQDRILVFGSFKTVTAVLAVLDKEYQYPHKWYQKVYEMQAELLAE